jgi:polygalacturonase
VSSVEQAAPSLFVRRGFGQANKIVPTSRKMIWDSLARKGGSGLAVSQQGWVVRRPMMSTYKKSALRNLETSLMLMACFMPLAAAQARASPGCEEAPKSGLVVNVKDKGARGDGQTDDTAVIQAAIDEAAGTGGTVFVPNGTYMINSVGKKGIHLGNDMTFKLSVRATLKAIPNSSKRYSVLRISGVSNVTVVGGTLDGEREQHMGKSGEWGMGIRMDRGAKNITISGVTARNMWGDGFYVRGAKNVTLCGVTADYNRRQGLSIVDADGVVVTNSLFKNTRGTRPSAGIDLEPNEEQAITNVRIQSSKFFDNAGSGIQIAGKRGRVSKIEITHNEFRGNRPLLVENAPYIRASAICDNRQISSQAAPSGGLNAFADPISIVVHQNDCDEGRDARFEVNRQKRKRSQ